MTQFGFAMGPFAVSDMSGLDIAWKMRQRLRPTRDPKAAMSRPPTSCAKQGASGRRQAKAGTLLAGAVARASRDPEVRDRSTQHHRAKGITRNQFTAGEIRRRALVAMVNEAALLLEEGIAARPSDVDLVMVNGYGFPSQEGGPLFWASRRTARRDRGRTECAGCVGRTRIPARRCRQGARSIQDLSTSGLITLIGLPAA